jgi:xylan 1,4-beta-xylosidase
MLRPIYFKGVVVVLGSLFTIAAGASAEPFDVKIRVDAGTTKGPLKPIWRYFGADEPNYAYMPTGKKLLRELGELAPKQVFFRTHNLLCTGDGTPALKWGSTNVYTEDADGNPVYDWTIVDRIFDTYRDAGVRPYAQIGFMPKALSTNPDPYQHNWKPGDPYERIATGWTYPPKDYKKWENLVYEWVKHCIERYGKEEVETWYWEVWNEADIAYWRGRPRNETFHRLHDHAIHGVKRALPTAKVGGPDAAYDGNFIRAFLDHCVNGTNYATGEKGTPIDFIAFHAKGSPAYVDEDRNDDVPGFGRMGMAQQLNAINNSMRIVASFPELKNTPIIIGESDPDGCAACRAIEYPANMYRNKSHFAAYTAASFARKHELADRNGVNLEGALSWTFTFEDQPYFAGLRSLATNGIDKPVLNTFRMFAKMSGQRLAVESDHGYTVDEIIGPRGGRRGARRGAQGEGGAAAAPADAPPPPRRTRDVRGEPDVHALASLDGNKLAVMVWHYHADDVPADAATVELTFANLPQESGEVRLTHFRIDDDHSNSFTLWKKMGEPQSPTPQQYAELEKAGKLAQIEAPATVTIENGQAKVSFELPRQGISLVVLEMK